MPVASPNAVLSNQPESCDIRYLKVLYSVPPATFLDFMGQIVHVTRPFIELVRVLGLPCMFCSEIQILHVQVMSWKCIYLVLCLICM